MDPHGLFAARTIVECYLIISNSHSLEISVGFKGMKCIEMSNINKLLGYSSKLTKGDRHDGFTCQTKMKAYLTR